jgi:hypothetical protein
METTVRQQPSTATESPIAQSGAVAGAERRMRAPSGVASIASIVPISPTMPVNTVYASRSSVTVRISGPD